MAVTRDAAAVARQHDIWTNLYGRARGDALTAALRRLLDEEPGLELRAAVARLDPEDDEQYEGWFATRW